MFICVYAVGALRLKAIYPYSNPILPYQYMKFTFLPHVSAVVHLNYGTATCTASCTVCTAVLLFTVATQTLLHTGTVHPSHGVVKILTLWSSDMFCRMY